MRFVNSLAFVAVCLTALSAAAQTCSDSDAGATGNGNNPDVRGVVTIGASAGSKKEYLDQCDSSGISVREFLCTTSGAVTSQYHRGLYGCLDGALVTPGITTPGCFTSLTLSFSPNGVAQPATKMAVESVEHQIAPLWWRASRGVRERDGAELEVVVRDGAKNPVTTVYARVNPKYFDISDPLLAAQGEALVVLPFLPAARSLLFKFDGLELAYPLPPAAMRCVRPAIPIGLSGLKNRDTCVAGAVPRAINATTFTCVPSALPTPASSPTPRSQ